MMTDPLDNMTDAEVSRMFGTARPDMAQDQAHYADLRNGGIIKHHIPLRLGRMLIIGALVVAVLIIAGVFAGWW